MSLILMVDLGYQGVVKVITKGQSHLVVGNINHYA
jgi:hypothetical protein